MRSADARQASQLERRERAGEPDSFRAPATRSREDVQKGRQRIGARRVERGVERGTQIVVGCGGFWGARHRSELAAGVLTLRASTAGGKGLPLNPDPYFFYTLAAPNGLVCNSIGYLDHAGNGHAALRLPAGLAAGLVGRTLHHA